MDPLQQYKLIVEWIPTIRSFASRYDGGQTISDDWITLSSSGAHHTHTIQPYVHGAEQYHDWLSSRS
jgi:hypothetical protein